MASSNGNGKRSYTNLSDQCNDISTEPPSTHARSLQHRRSTIVENQHNLLAQYDKAWNYFQQCTTETDLRTVNAALKNVFDCLMALQNEWKMQQRRSSLLIEPYVIDSFELRQKFQDIIHILKQMQFDQKEYWIDAFVQSSFIIEWPKTVIETNGLAKISIVADCAPLQQSAKSKSNLVRKDCPTFRARILALSGTEALQLHNLTVTAKLVTHDTTNQNYRIAGSIFPVQRQGKKCVPRAMEQYFRRDGAHESITLENSTVHAQQFHFEDGALCVDFGEIGVTVGATDEKRRNRIDRYFVEVNFQLKFDSGQTINKTVHSNPFLIAINQEQNDQVIGDIVWDILSATSIATNCMTEFVNWSVLREMIQNFVRSQLPGARALDDEEIWHIQCMLFLPLALRQNQIDEQWEFDAGITNFEQELFGANKRSTSGARERVGMKLIKYRLLRENVRDTLIVTRETLMQQKCISLRDYSTKLSHNVWQWLFAATELIIDRNAAKHHIDGENKKSMMCELFNERIITMSSEERLWKVFKTVYLNDVEAGRVTIKESTKAMAIRFCEDKAENLVFMYCNKESPDRKPNFGTVTPSTIKSYNGLLEYLFEAPWPKKYDRIIHFIPQTDATNTNLGSKRASSQKLDMAAASSISTPLFTSQNSLLDTIRSLDLAPYSTLENLIDTILNQNETPELQSTMDEIFSHNFEQDTTVETIIHQLRSQSSESQQQLPQLSPTTLESHLGFSSDWSQHLAAASSSFASNDTSTTSPRIRQGVRITKKDQLLRKYRQIVVDASTKVSSSCKKSKTDNKHNLEINATTGEVISNQAGADDISMESIREVIEEITEGETVGPDGSRLV